MSIRILLGVTLVTFLLTTNVSAIGPIPCNNPNEEYQCGSACQTTCATLGEPCRIMNIRCNDACYCKDGYARGADGVCIPISQCPKRRPSGY